MAPEQLEGKPTDARTDLWALGAILYEMMAGKRAFEGGSAASLIGAILEREPTPLANLQPLTPPSVERLVKRCLAKDPEERWASAYDVASELRLLRETSGPAARPEVRPRRRRASDPGRLTAES
jgi:serine/threonine protein kinase